MSGLDSQKETYYPDIKERDGWTIGKNSGVEDKSGNQLPFAKSKEAQIILSNREFKEIDEYVNNRFLALILKKIKENPNRQTVVLDLDGGVYSKPVRGILRHPMLKGRVKCVNIDLFAVDIPREILEQENINPDDLVVLNEDFAQNNLPDNSVDAIISWQAMNYMDDATFYKAITEVARILAPGGEAYLNMSGLYVRDRDYNVLSFPSMEEYAAQPWRQELYNRGIFFQCFETEDENHTREGTSTMIHMAKKKGNSYPFLDDFDLAFPEIEEAVKKYE